MRRRKIFTLIACMIMSLLGGTVVSGCGTVRSHWGIEHEYDFSDGHRHHKHKKHKKHRKHHHHDDDDEDDDCELIEFVSD